MFAESRNIVMFFDYFPFSARAFIFITFGISAARAIAAMLFLAFIYQFCSHNFLLIPLALSCFR